MRIPYLARVEAYDLSLFDPNMTESEKQAVYRKINIADDKFVVEYEKACQLKHGINSAEFNAIKNEGLALSWPVAR